MGLLTSRDHSCPSDRLIRRNQEAEPSPQQRDAQERIRDKKQRSAAKSVDGEEGRQGEDPVENASSHGYEESVATTIARILKDCRGIVRYYINTAWIASVAGVPTRLVSWSPTELLAEHNNPRRPSRSSVTRNAEKLPEHGENVLAGVDLGLDFDTNVSVV